MKRPEGFDRTAAPANEPNAKQSAAKSGRAKNAPKVSAPKTTAPNGTAPKATAPKRTAPNATAPKVGAPKVGAPKSSPSAVRASKGAPRAPRDRKLGPEARRELRKAAAARRRYERGEVRRFTRRSRRRRITWIAALVSFVLLGVLVTGAVYSPILSLKTITFVGNSRIPTAQLEKAVESQLGTPLALVDFDAIKKELGQFPLIRSYVTESAPPDTLIIRLAERAPIAVLQAATGFSVIDAAGVELQQSTTRPDKLPLLTGGAAIEKSAAFRSSVDVLLALPTGLSGTVDSVTAATADNVTITFTSGTTVLWGSDEDSAHKGQVLAALIAANPGALRYDVTAPNAPVYVPR
jgi:cell division protein FtsQ